MTLGMPSPRLNWLLALLGIAVSAVVSGLILVAFRDALFLYLAVTLLWIFTCLLFSNWYPLPATLERHGVRPRSLRVFPGDGRGPPCGSTSPMKPTGSSAASRSSWSKLWSGR